MLNNEIYDFTVHYFETNSVSYREQQHHKVKIMMELNILVLKQH